MTAAPSRQRLVNSFMALLLAGSGCGGHTPSPGSEDGGMASGSCGPMTCAGCCDAEGFCRRGLDDAACGTEGASCNDCKVDGDICSEGRCVAKGCGNGILEDGEKCDGEALDGETCTSLGFDSGTLACAPDCTFDTSRCELDECRTDREGPQRCEFCAETVEDAVVRCGYCQDCSDGSCPADEVELCSDDEQCIEHDDSTAVPAECIPEDAETCTAEAFEGRCEGDSRVECLRGYVRRFDCSPGACLIGLREKPVCLEEGREECVPEDHERYCEGDGIVYCDWNGVEKKDECPDGETCLEGSTGRRACVPPGTSTCDPDSYDRRCEGRGLWVCSSEGLEVFNADFCPTGKECAIGDDGIAHCVDDASSTCDGATFEEHCEGGTAVKCDSDAGLVYRVECSDPNPVCRENDGFAGCTFTGAEPCEWTVDRRCKTGSPEYIYECSSGLGVEIRRGCLELEGEQCTCQEDGVFNRCLSPSGEPCGTYG